MPYIPVISVEIEMERSVSVSSDRNIRDHLWRWSTYFGWNIPIEIRRSIFDNYPFFFFFFFFALIREFGKGIKSGKSHSYWLARFNRKMSFHFPRVIPLISDRSAWQHGKHPMLTVSKRACATCAPTATLKTLQYILIYCKTLL